jgi:hypothetical protein
LGVLLESKPGEDNQINVQEKVTAKLINRLHENNVHTIENYNW